MAYELQSLAAVILAGGKGTRMKSRLPKVLHPVADEPMIFHPLRALAQAGIPPERTAIVVGYGGEQVRQALAGRGPYLFAEQPQQLGTGHALMMAETVLQSLEMPAEHILLVYGDNPMLRSQTLENLLSRHLATRPLVTMATATLDDPTGYGRIVRHPQTGYFQAIVEQADLTLEQVTIKEFNPGVYVFRSKWVWPALKRIKVSQKGEYYLTDLPGLAVEALPDGQGVETVPIEAEEVLGINDRVQLAEVSNLLRARILRHWMLEGVTITDPATTYISAESEIGPDSVIEPNTHLRGRCRIGSNCVIGPNSLLEEARLGDGVTILASIIEHSTLEDGVAVGPFSRVRPGSHLESEVRLGNFAEVSRSRIGTGTRMGHFSFMGDATLGPDVNIGAGTITANYDGVNKNKTTVGAHVFLGCDTILRAPIEIGDHATTGAGSVVTRNVQPGVTVVGLPARPIKRKAGFEPSASNTQVESENGVS